MNRHTTSDRIPIRALKMDTTLRDIEQKDLWQFLWNILIRDFVTRGTICI